MPIPAAAFNIAAALPALTPIEDAVAKAWLTKHQAEYSAVQFNVRLGTGVILASSDPEYMKRFARAATTKRADMILFNGDLVTIVEVKIRIGGSALGQLQLYRKLYMAEHPEVKTPALVAVGQTIEPDVAELYADHGVTVELFPSVGLPAPA